MTRRRALRGVLAGFLGTYMSRYSDHVGYWLFGQIGALRAAQGLGWDTLAPHGDAAPPSARG